MTNKIRHAKNSTSDNHFVVCQVHKLCIEVLTYDAEVQEIKILAGKKYLSSVVYNTTKSFC